MKINFGRQRSPAALCWLALTAIVVQLAACSGDPGAPRGASGPTMPATAAPLSDAMEQEFGRLRELLPEQRLDAFEGVQATWLARREQQCAATVELIAGSQDPNTALDDCRTAADEQHMRTLRALHLELLIQAEPLPLAAAGATRARTSFPTTGVIRGLVASPRTSLVVAVGTPELIAFDAVSRTTLYRAPVESSTGRRPVISPNGRLLATNALNRTSVRLWDAESGHFLRDIEAHARYAPFVFLPDSRHLAIGATRLQVVDLLLDNTTTVQRSVTGISALDANADFIAVGSRAGEIELYSLSWQDDLATVEFQQRATAGTFRSEVTGLALADRQPRLTSTVHAGIVDRWSLPDLQKSFSLQSGLASLYFMAAAPDDDIVYLSGRADGPEPRNAVIALDMVNRMSKTVYQAPVSNARAITLHPQTETLFVERNRHIHGIPAAVDRAGFTLLESLGSTLPVASVAPTPRRAPRVPITAGIRPTAARPPAPPNPDPAIAGIAEDARVHAIGVYEGTLPDGQRRRFQEHKQGVVTVNVGGSGRAVLVLTAYEPVKWIVRPRGVFIDQVLLFGYHEQEADVPPGTKVYSNLQSSVNTSGIYAYKRDQNFSRLAQAILEITGKEISTFQGKYRAATFSLTSGPVGTSGDGVNRWVDDDGVVHYGDRPPPGRKQ